MMTAMKRFTIVMKPKRIKNTIKIIENPGLIESSPNTSYMLENSCGQCHHGALDWVLEALLVVGVVHDDESKSETNYHKKHDDDILPSSASTSTQLKAEMALISTSPATHPPTHPPTRNSSENSL